MTRPRRDLVSVADTPYYHCISRCVRRAFLCGRDTLTGRDFSHRRYWILRRMRHLASVFAIDVCAFAIMANHYHLVLRVDARRASGWSVDEVIARWRKLFDGPPLVQQYVAGQVVDAAQLEYVFEIAARWRERLMDLSWYMRVLNEHIARRANAEDECTGRFWEGRFKTQALLDEQALLTCMAYVDLNPVRARQARTPEASTFTSVFQRIAARAGTRSCVRGQASLPKCPLLAFAGEGIDANRLPFTTDDYLALVDWSGRAVRPDRPGAIPWDLPPILLRLGIDCRCYIEHVARTAGSFARALGTSNDLRQFAARCGRRFIKGIGAANALFRMAGPGVPLRA